MSVGSYFSASSKSLSSSFRIELDNDKVECGLDIWFGDARLNTFSLRSIDDDEEQDDDNNNAPAAVISLP